MNTTSDNLPVGLLLLVPPIPRRISYQYQNGDGLRITWLGHSSTIIEMDKAVILTDPVFSKKIVPFPLLTPKRFHKNFPVDVKDLPEIDAVIISHNHYDHLNYETIKELHEKTRYFYVPLGIGAYLEKWGVIPEKITEMDWWDEVDCGNGLKIAATPAQHFSGRGLTDGNKTLWTSWVITGQNHRVFFSGDSGYFSGFQEIGERYGPFDVTMIEIAAYNSKYWPDVHMVPEDALKACNDLGGRLMIPVHWGTFNLAIHDWTEPIERLLKAASDHSVPVAAPRAGERITYGKEIPRDCWWR